MRGRWFKVLFLLLSVVAGAMYWRNADWWVYVHMGERGKVPKFQLSIAEQFLVSAVVGLLVVGVLTAVVLLARTVWETWRGQAR